VIDAKTFNADMLPPLQVFTGADVSELRTNLGVSRPVFAMIFNVSVSAVRVWEGRTDSALSGGDLVLANQLANKGLSAYLSGATGSSERTVSEAAYEVLATIEVKRNAMVVSPLAVERLKGALGLREPEHSAESVIRLAKAKAIASFSEELGAAVRDADSVADVETALRSLTLKWTIQS
jgi:DNA-binding transcriptional regulator YiaG